MLLTNRRGDVAYTDLTFAPGAYTGWHSHPGFVVVTVVEGSLDAYDKHCQLQKFTAGQSFTEGAGHVHDVLNQGTANARVLALYITKQGSPRRLDVDQPPCAVGAGLP